MATYPNESAPAVSETTPTGTGYERVTVGLSTGDPALLTVPTSAQLGSPVTLVIGCHGHGGSNNTFETHAPSLGVRDRMTDDGYVFMSPHMHGNTWGNQVAMDDIAAAYAYAAALWTVSNVLLFGGSMGGLAAVNAGRKGVVPDVRAVAVVAPALNLRSNYDSASYKPSVEAAYGVATDGADYDSKTAGFDPILSDPAEYNGDRYRFYHSPDDTAITKVSHSDLFVANGLTAQMADFQLLTMAGGHLEAGNYDAEDTSEFFAAALSAGVPAAPTPGVPVSVTEVKVWDGASWVVAAPKVWNGSAWDAVTPTGYVAA